MRLRSRLDRLEQRVGSVGSTCPACRDRLGCVVFFLTSAIRLPDGTVVPSDEGPKPCVACGKVVEQFIEIVETLVEAADYDAPPPRDVPAAGDNTGGR